MTKKELRLNGAPVSMDGLFACTKLQDLLESIITAVNEQGPAVARIATLEKNVGSDLLGRVDALERSSDFSRNSGKRLVDLEAKVHEMHSGGGTTNFAERLASIEGGMLGLDARIDLHLAAFATSQSVDLRFEGVTREARRLQERFTALEALMEQRLEASEKQFRERLAALEALNIEERLETSEGQIHLMLNVLGFNAEGKEGEDSIPKRLLDLAEGLNASIQTAADALKALGFELREDIGMLKAGRIDTVARCQALDGRLTALESIAEAKMRERPGVQGVQGVQAENSSGWAKEVAQLKAGFRSLDENVQAECEKEVLDVQRLQEQIRYVMDKLDALTKVQAGATARCLTCFNNRATTQVTAMEGSDGKVYRRRPATAECRPMEEGSGNGILQRNGAFPMRGSAGLPGGAGEPLRKYREGPGVANASVFAATDAAPLRRAGSAAHLSRPRTAASGGRQRHRARSNSMNVDACYSSPEGDGLIYLASDFNE